MCAHPQNTIPWPWGSSLLSSSSDFVHFQEAAVLLSMVYRSYVLPRSVRMFGFIPALLAEHTWTVNHFFTAIINTFQHRLHPRK